MDVRREVARNLQQRADALNEEGNRAPKGTPTAKARADLLFQAAQNCRKDAEDLLQEEKEIFLAGVLKEIPESDREYLTFELARLLEDEREYRVRLGVGDLGYVLKWDCRDMMETSLKRQVLRDQIAAIENPENPEYGLREAVDNLKDRFKYYNPTSQSTSPSHNLYDAVEFKVFKDLAEKFESIVRRIDRKAKREALAATT